MSNVQDALRSLEMARKRIPMKGMGKNSEATYAMAYQRLVKLGHYRQLRGKYRV